MNHFKFAPFSVATILLNMAVIMNGHCSNAQSQTALAFNEPIGRIIASNKATLEQGREFAADPQWDNICRLKIKEVVFPGNESGIPDVPNGGCSGTLISPKYVLSARHCVCAFDAYELPNGDFADKAIVPEDIRVKISFGPEADKNPKAVFDVIKVIQPPENIIPGLPVSKSLSASNDIIILELDRPVPANIATPRKLTSQTKQLVGKTSLLMGYGRFGLPGDSDRGRGIRHSGKNRIDSYGRAARRENQPMGKAENNNVIIIDFDSGVVKDNRFGSHEPIEHEANTNGGDSGGPLLVQVNQEWVVAGVAAAGENVTTGTGPALGDVTFGSTTHYCCVAALRAWIESHGGTFID